MMVVAESNIRIFAEQEKTNICVPFVLKSGGESLKITFSYSPKILNDNQKAISLIKDCLSRDAGEFADEYCDYSEFLPLKNLITISLDSPNGYVGAAHRHSPSQTVLISETESSNGFIPCKIAAGEWSVVINVHAVVTDYCDFNLKVEVEEAETNE